MLSISSRSFARFSTIAKLFQTNQNYKCVAESPITNTNGAVNKRFFGTLKERALAQPQCVTQDEVEEFISYFPEIVRDLTVRSPYQDIPEVIENFTKVLEYNVPHGKKNRGLGTVAAYKAFASAEKLTPENIRLANILGWGPELMQASLIVEDDIEDSSKFRRGLPCWYTVEGVGLRAISDVYMLENSFHSLLKKHFSHLDCYVSIIELYHEIFMKTRIGQWLDFMCLVDGKVQFDYFTMPVLSTIAEHKSTYHAFRLPIRMAMYLAGKHDSALVQQVDPVLQGLGQFYQFENDIQDCFGDLSQTKKNGNDIAKGKCTWLAVMALQRATPAQRNIFQENYGRAETECEAVIRNFYEEMNLLDAYHLYKKNSFNFIRASIDRMSDELPKGFFCKFLKHIYKMDY